MKQGLNILNHRGNANQNYPEMLSHRIQIGNHQENKQHEEMLTISGHKGNANQNHTKIPTHPC
jgi:hypothetical protein